MMNSPAGDLASSHDRHDACDEVKSRVPLCAATAPTTEAPAIEAASEAGGDDEFDATSELFGTARRASLRAFMLTRMNVAAGISASRMVATPFPMTTWNRTERT